MGSESDSDVDNLLQDLLANNEEPDEEPSTNEKEIHKSDVNFLDIETNIANKPVLRKAKTVVRHEDIESSDEEDKRDFQHQKYSDSGREIKAILKHSSSDRNLSYNNIPPCDKSETFKTKSIKQLSCPTDTVKKESYDVYCDPIFGLRIIKPLISSSMLSERMIGRKAVTISNIKSHLAGQDLQSDWVIAGVIIHKSPVRKSQKGNHYSIWKVSDLSDNIKSVSLFLFSGAHKELWKTSLGTVIGVLNPNVMDNKDENTIEATLSVDNPQKVMILGTSKDMGTCKSKKKNGEPCTVVVNLNRCEYCVYHIRQEYNKCARRMDLQSSSSGRGLAAPKGLKNRLIEKGNLMYEAQNFSCVPATKNFKLIEKDKARLQLLQSKNPVQAIPQPLNSPVSSQKACLVELTNAQMKKDTERLKKLKSSITVAERPPIESCNPSSLSHLKSNTVVSSVKSPELKTGSSHQVNSNATTIPRLGVGLFGNTIDLSEPISKTQKDMAKVNAIKWIQKNGVIKKNNPNKIHLTPQEKIERAQKRRREESPDIEENAKKQRALASRFQEMLKATSNHEDLVEKADDQAKEKYFNKLEIKEKMEEKMMTTFKVDCKAVTCLVCKYTSFSASAICKAQSHPLRVTDGVKRFFKCRDCKNRTTTLDKLPTYSCQNCHSSNWIRAAMMDERKIELPGTSLCIRGGEEKFIGSIIKDGSLNLSVPDD